MNTTELGKVIRRMAKGIYDDGIGEPMPRPEDADIAELLRVLARLVEGKSVGQAFGAPGDWGYGTPIGEAIRSAPAVLNARSEK